MPVSLSDFRDVAALDFDEIIDVRSPSEYAEDHIAGAVNLPVLSDAERAQVGTIYTQESPFKARKIGAALVAQNAARHLQTFLSDKPGGYRPLVYCWRGGQRSNAFASILSQIGWRSEVLKGGYKSYRRLVVETLYKRPLPSLVMLLDGDTGSGKTEILQNLVGLDWQIIDLEHMARHRGSVLGGFAEPQPSQKSFESNLAWQVSRLDPNRPVVVEAESSKVGAINLPPSLWSAMRLAPRLVLQVPRLARVRHLLRNYGDLSLAETSDRLGLLRRQHGVKQLEQWQDMLARGETEALALSLMELHYDPLYRRGREGRTGSPLSLGETALDPNEMAATTARVSAGLKALSPQAADLAEP
ncbi:MAG: tRNA 2-selenouridine(34) synthase MnmH [Pseudomonadota bacterium]